MKWFHYPTIDPLPHDQKSQPLNYWPYIPLLLECYFWSVPSQWKKNDQPRLKVLHNNSLWLSLHLSWRVEPLKWNSQPGFCMSHNFETRTEVKSYHWPNKSKNKCFEWASEIMKPIIIWKETRLLEHTNRSKCNKRTAMRGLWCGGEFLRCIRRTRIVVDISSSFKPFKNEVTSFLLHITQPIHSTIEKTAIQ